MNSLTSGHHLTSVIIGLPIWTGLFGCVVPSVAPFLFQDAPCLAAAIVSAIALLLAVRWLTTDDPMLESSASPSTV